jgi:hypothetical protein
MNSTVRRRGRGNKPAMVHTNVRLPEYVVDYFKEHHSSYTAEIRNVLEAHVQELQSSALLFAEENDE